VCLVPNSSPSGTNRTPGVDRREAIIDVAAGQFAQLGYHAVSMRDIARENKSSVASLYNHFESKDALLLAVGRRFFDTFVKRLEKAAIIDGDSRERMVEMLRVSMQEGLRHRDAFVAISRDRHHIRNTADLEPLVVAVERCLELWYQVMRAGQGNGSIRPDLDAATTIWSLMSAITGLIDSNSMVAIVASAPVSPVATLCTIFSEGLRPVPSGAS
jgi:TetR/AcrR family transcriptional regulator, cholesterol catabolism regulator